VSRQHPSGIHVFETDYLFPTMHTILGVTARGFSEKTSRAGFDVHLDTHTRTRAACVCVDLGEGLGV
jgi:hypothetical protein